MPYVTQMLQLYEQSIDAIRDGDEPAGKLTIGVSESLMIYYLPRLIPAFSEKYPHVRLEVKSVDYADLITQLKYGDYDVALLVEMADWEPSEVTLSTVRVEELKFVGALSTTPLTEQTMFVAERTRSWQQRVRSSMRKVIELPSIEAVKQCVLSGLGVSLLPSFVVQNELQAGSLQELHEAHPRDQVGIFTVHHEKKWVSASMNAFLKEVHILN
ncbi:LysR family transcriptional regulator [Geomicrobium sp. JSM 1781026]|uniref:LysR family transcriptional regulator n=1 Tax=Geomicrobium sp. JSM 1781026 TaxID=3344580 RepID=UPI0035BF2A5C